MPFLRRKVYFQLKEHLSSKDISLILGPRQAGKTTLMLKLAEELEARDYPYSYFNLDIIEDRQYFKTQQSLIDRVEKSIGKGKAVIFIDEIQRLENAGLFLKGLYDLKTDHKFVVSGSGSLELKANIVEPMTGRKKVFYCLPLSFTEFAAAKSANLSTNVFERQRLAREYLTYGGYPRVVLAPTHREKIDTLSEIYKSYLEKDVQLLLGVEKEVAFGALVKALAGQIGGLVNRAELSATLGVTQKTVERYLYLLEKTFIISRVSPFFSNVRKEIRKSPKIYFLDLGLLHLARGIIPLPQGKVSGDVFENGCFLRMGELEALEPLRFWRSTSGAEVDFVMISPKTGEPLPVEVKLKPGKIGTLGKSLISFLKRYKPEKAFVYTEETEGKVERFGSKIFYTPFYLLPEMG